MKFARRHAALLLAALAAPALARADNEQRFDVGLRGIITAASGEPANDIPGYGAFGHYRWNEDWTIGFSVDRTEYDYEEPAKILGIPTDPAVEPIDAVAEATVVGAWLERTFAAPQARTI